MRAFAFAFWISSRFFTLSILIWTVLEPRWRPLNYSRLFGGDVCPKIRSLGGDNCWRLFVPLMIVFGRLAFVETQDSLPQHWLRWLAKSQQRHNLHMDLKWFKSFADYHVFSQICCFNLRSSGDYEAQCVIDLTGMRFMSLLYLEHTHTDS